MTMTGKREHAPSYETLKQWDHQHLWHPFTQMQQWVAEDPLVIVRGEGNELIDSSGRRYLDGVSSLWCNVHGHNRPELNLALESQLHQIAHSTLLGLTHPPAVELARRLTELTPSGLTRVFYSDDGATAVEVAIRMALQYWQLAGAPAKTRLASLRDDYHGDTLGAVGVGYSEAFHRFYRPVVAEAVRLTPPHIWRWREWLSEPEALDRALVEAERVLSQHADQLAALVVEPVMQGAVGMWPQPPGYLRALRELTARFDILLVCDEVATGFGRTGTMFACEQEQVSPDILCLAKGLTGGYVPLAATLATEQLYTAFLGPPAEGRTFFYGHTYTGNPLGCAVALASLDLFDTEQVIASLGVKITRLTGRLADEIAPLSHVADVRQRGLMVGIELARDAATRTPYGVADRVGAAVAVAARSHGVIVRPLGDVVVLMPPLSVTLDEIDRLVGAVRDAITMVTMVAET
jgi:adenosylmethionine-8-amino-7-oxononanoate aminotransferase